MSLLRETAKKSIHGQNMINYSMINKLTLLTVTAASMLFVSCGDESPSSKHDDGTSKASSEEKQFYSQADVLLQQDIAKFTSDMLIATPSYLELTGPKKVYSYSEDSKLITIDHSWSWNTKEPLYTLDSELNSGEKTFSVLKQVSDTGSIGTHIAKAICSVGADGTVSFVRFNSIADSFHASTHSFNLRGKPKTSFVNAVILGTEDHRKAVSAQKLFNDRMERETLARQQEAKAKKAAFVNTQIKKYSEVLSEGSVFEGILTAKNSSNEQTAKMSMHVDSVSRKAGLFEIKTTLTHTFKSYQKTAKVSATFRGVLDENGNLRMTTLSHYSKPKYGKWDLVGKPDKKFTIFLTDHKDRVKLTSNTRSWEISGDMLRK